LRFAAIDIGTNSCRLLIAEVDKKTGLKTLHQDLETPRIGEGVNQSGLLKEEAIKRALISLDKYREKMYEYGVTQYRAIATSAVREAKNGNELVHRAGLQSQIKVDIVDGEEEASLSYLGVKLGLNLRIPPLVADLGGGSTEFICPEENFLLSVPLGAVRVREAGMGAAQIREVLTPLRQEKERFKQRPMVMVGGTASSLAAIKMGMEQYKSAWVHGAILNRAEIEDLYRLLEGMPLTLRQRLPGLQPERADIINQGALIILMMVDMLGKKEIVVSESDLLQGIIWSLNPM
jgi:exopolyphosphatase/guanosine-5'-triphosphate,3'-diphosphate pyrophosphatase